MNDQAPLLALRQRASQNFRLSDVNLLEISNFMQPIALSLGDVRYPARDLLSNRVAGRNRERP